MSNTIFCLCMTWDFYLTNSIFILKQCSMPDTFFIAAQKLGGYLPKKNTLCYILIRKFKKQYWKVFQPHRLTILQNWQLWHLGNWKGARPQCPLSSFLMAPMATMPMTTTRRLRPQTAKKHGSMSCAARMQLICSIRLENCYWEFQSFCWFLLIFNRSW